MGFGTTEALIVLGIVLLMFGGKKLPELGSAMGRSLANFKKGLAAGGEEKKALPEEEENPSQQG